VFGGGLASGKQAIDKKYAAELASGPSIGGKIVQVHSIGNDICAITEWSLGIHTIGHYAVLIYVREGDHWRIRIHYVN
jgi:hypothetical protein